MYIYVSVGSYVWLRNLPQELKQELQEALSEAGNAMESLGRFLPCCLASIVLCPKEMYETPPKIVAAEASWIETESISKLFQLSPDWLQPVSSGQATNWSSDPLFKGAYSFLPTGSMRNGWDVVNERHGRPWQCVLYLCCVLMVTIILY